MKLVRPFTSPSMISAPQRVLPHPYKCMMPRPVVHVSRPTESVVASDFDSQTGGGEENVPTNAQSDPEWQMPGINLNIGLATEQRGWGNDVLHGPY